MATGTVKAKIILLDEESDLYTWELTTDGWIKAGAFVYGEEEVTRRVKQDVRVFIQLIIEMDTIWN